MTRSAIEAGLSVAASTLRTRGRKLVDESDRQVILRGVNLSGRHKQPPFLLTVEEANLDRIRESGFNVVRLVSSWEALEPEPNQLDEGYLSKVRALCEALNERGVHVIFDMHQDIYSRAFGGSGAPAWSIPEPHRAPEPGPDRAWFMSYASSEGVRDCLTRFWKNEDDMWGHFIRGLVAAARTLKNLPGVIGCEIYNEPFCADIDPAEFEPKYLQPFYENAIAQVREVAPHWICFVEGALMISESGTHLDLNRIENCVYYPHFYDKLTHVSRVYGGDSSEMDRAFAAFDKDSRRMDVPWMLGEYGVAQDTENGPECLLHHQRALERYRAGGTTWHYNPTTQGWNDENMSVVGPGGERTPLLDAIDHPYPRAVAGDIEEYGFNQDESTFRLSFASSGGDSWVHLPRRIFGTDPKIELSGGEHAFDAEQQLLVVRASSDARVVLNVSA